MIFRFLDDIFRRIPRVQKARAETLVPTQKIRLLNHGTFEYNRQNVNCTWLNSLPSLNINPLEYSLHACITLQPLKLCSHCFHFHCVNSATKLFSLETLRYTTYITARNSLKHIRYSARSCSRKTDPN